MTHPAGPTDRLETGLTREELLKWAAAAGVGLSALGTLAGRAHGASLETVKAAWVYIGPPGDGGWTYQHELGRQAAGVEVDPASDEATHDDAMQDDAAALRGAAPERGRGDRRLGPQRPDIPPARRHRRADPQHPDGVKVENSYITMPELPGIGFEGKADLYRVMQTVSA